MKYLFNGCRRSEINVTPQNWKSKRASLKKDWRIYYRYYDPRTKSNPELWGKMFVIRGMNEFKTLQERQEVTKKLIEQESELLDQQGWNPITCEWMISNTEVIGISKETPFIEALNLAFANITGVRVVLNDIRSVINGVEQSSKMLFDRQKLLKYDQIPISEIRHKHLKDILKNCYNTNSNFTDYRYNRYKDYLNKLFKELLDEEAIEYNPVKDLQKKPVVKKLKEVLTEDEEKEINEHLKTNHYHFWRFMQIFFYSDARETELMRLQATSAIDLTNQSFRVTVIKGRIRREVEKQISNNVLELWKEVLKECNPGYFLFSKNLKPGPKPIRPDQIGRRWAKYVKAPKDKGGLSITKDFRSLNHLHLTKVSRAVGIKAASESRSHTTPIITMTRYDVNFKKELLNEVRNADINFG